MRQQHKRVLTTRPACQPSLTSCLSLLGESLSSVPDAYGQSLEALLSQLATSGSESHVPGVVSEEEYHITIVVSDEHGAETRVHIPAYGGSEAHNGLSDSILLHESKPLGRHRPPLPKSVWSPNELSYPP
ncbi:hypothetical protein Tco_1506016 [Tanacetum coccineum]